MDRFENTLAPPGGAVANSSLLSRRRKSRASRSYATRKNSMAADQASPEVISSLISSLSTISVPVQSHFDNVPCIESANLPSPPSFFQSEFPSTPNPRPHTSHEPGFGVTYGLPKPPQEPEDPYLHPEDAAAAPVVRMARAEPSPKTKTTFDPPPSPIRPTSRASYTSSRMAHDDTAFGKISAEPSMPASKAPSIASSSSGGRKSLKGSLGLFQKSSYDEKDWKANGLRKTKTFSDSPKHNVPRSRASLRSMYSMADVVEEGRPRSFTTDEHTTNAVSNSPSREFQPLQSVKGPASNIPGGIGSGLVPARDSSLRHSSSKHLRSRHRSGSTKEPKEPKSKESKQKSKESKSKEPKSKGTKESMAEESMAEESMAEESMAKESKEPEDPKESKESKENKEIKESKETEEVKVDSGVFGTGNSEAEQVTKRIQELKDQQLKIKTELETDNTPTRAVHEPKETPGQPVPTEISRKPYEETVEHPSPPSPPLPSPVTAVVFDESAPAPAVLTGKSSRTMSRNGAPMPVKTTSRPTSVRQSVDQVEKLRYRQSLEPSTPTKRHRRSPSLPVSVADERPSSADSIDAAVSDYISSPNLTERVPHPTTGRMIAFSDVGDPKGHVVLCCLGMGLTRYLMAFYDELARTLKLRLITLDRPGVGESDPYTDETGTPLGWPDDVAIVCNHLKVTKFSLLAHSAGAIYALATALRNPQHIRGRIHLLAPWIPPSQLSSIGTQKEPAPNNAVPYSQRILRALPTSILKVANSSFMSATSASLTSSLPKSPRRSRRGKTTAKDSPTAGKMSGPPRAQSRTRQHGDDIKAMENVQALGDFDDSMSTGDAEGDHMAEDRERQIDYDNRLTHKIWELATTNANPAIDLLICLERRRPIGFRYVDITRAVVIHHGGKDTRVPVDNVRWLGKTMRRCEVRILEEEGHGLMASAAVMGGVLMEIAKEWEDWMVLVQGKRKASPGETRSGIAQRA